MTGRRAPSLRNAEYADRHQGRQLQSMVPGAVGGRLASAGLILPGTGGVSAIEPAMAGGGDEASNAEDHQIDTFLLTGTSPLLTLTYVPTEGSYNVSLNGLAQKLGTDFTIGGKSLLMLTGLAESGDEVVAQYDYLVDMPDVPEEPDVPEDPSEFTSGVLVVDAGEHDQSIEFDWVTNRVGTGQQWAVFALRSDGTPLGHRLQKADRAAGGSDYAITQLASGHTQVAITATGLDSGLLAHYKISIVGDVFEIEVDGSLSPGSYDDFRADSTYPELAGNTKVYIDTAGGEIANLVVTGIP